VPCTLSSMSPWIVIPSLPTATLAIWAAISAGRAGTRPGRYSWLAVQAVTFIAALVSSIAAAAGTAGPRASHVYVAGLFIVWTVAAFGGGSVLVYLVYAFTGRSAVFGADLRESLWLGRAGFNTLGGVPPQPLRSPPHGRSRSRTSSELVTCIVKANRGSWEVTWISDIETPGNFKASGLTESVTRAMDKAYHLRSEDARSRNAELQFAIYPFKGSGSTILDIGPTERGYTATPLDGGGPGYGGRTLELLVNSVRTSLGDSNDVMFRWVIHPKDVRTQPRAHL
jgi:hypothetical protein